MLRALNPLPPNVLPPRAILFDWAGTTVDYGSRAPTAVFMEIFRASGVSITALEARGPMGRAKRDHIAEIANLPRVSQAWQQLHGRMPTDLDVQTMYDSFLPLQKRALAAGCDLIPGLLETIKWCRVQGFKIGASTGYTRALMDVVEPIAAHSGYKPDVSICSDDVPAGRPAPWMNFRAAERLGVFPMSAIVVVDDTPIGITAGLNAGCVTVAVSESGNQMGLSLEELNALPKSERERRVSQIEEDFRKSGAHFAIPSVAELPSVIHALREAIV